MTIVKVASKNSLKVEGIKKAFEYYFEDVQIEAFQAESQIGIQPIDDDIFKGAENRLNYLKNSNEFEEYDYIVSCEGGLINHYNQWFNIQVVMIEKNNVGMSVGVSQAYPIPQKYVPQIIKTELSVVLKEIFKGQGGTRVITKNVFTRADLVRDATVMALTGFINGEIWEK